MPVRKHIAVWWIAVAALVLAPRALPAQPASVDSPNAAKMVPVPESLPDDWKDDATLTSGCCTDDCCCQSCEGWFDNLSIFGGLEGSKQPQDFGINAHFGGRIHVNWGIPLLREWGIGGQIGSSFNFTDNAVQVVERIEGSSSRQQFFHTVGVFRSTDYLRWGVAYDILNQDYVDRFNLGQWRVKFEVPVTSCDDIGLWGAIAAKDDQGVFAGVPVTMRPISQGNLYWTHVWDHEARTTIWAGFSEGHHESNLALGDLPSDDNSFVFGAELHIPLNDRFALYGQANFIRPTDTGTVDAFLGLVYYPATSAYQALRQRFAPLFSVANNPTFGVDLFR